MKFMVRVFDLIYQQSVRLLNEFFENEKNAEFKVDAHRKFIELCKQNKTKEAIKYWSDFLSALEKLVNPKLELKSTNLAIIPTEWNTEILCWELKGRTEDNDFLVYINAKTGEEEDILMIINSDEGTVTT